MPEFTVNTSRFDAYKNARFLVYFGSDPTPVVAISGLSGLAWNAQVITQRAGGNANTFILAPGMTSFEPLTLVRGLTQDTAFADWARLQINIDNGVASGPSLRELRRQLRIVVLNEEGQPAVGFILYRCWPSRYQAIGPLDAEHPTTLVESLTLQYESFQRDPSITEIAET